MLDIFSTMWATSVGQWFGASEGKDFLFSFHLFFLQNLDLPPSVPGLKIVVISRAFWHICHHHLSNNFKNCHKNPWTVENWNSEVFLILSPILYLLFIGNYEPHELNDTFPYGRNLESKSLSFILYYIISLYNICSNRFSMLCSIAPCRERL